ncbi:Uncharacterized protein TPAR_08564 [Tolypocladium paradoxum]|uniref:Zn(2)-C6 fungal-type domain-containing protein n=1 Tax=Tolypocladium paradoxum TaxID=94208 RepID=A0A2S4KM03_9HYPO|nr:Uncharacterized protein TPAR_08564 [Tolypocladium paradoxum]
MAESVPAVVREFHQSLTHKRPRSCAEGEVSSLPLQSFIPLVDTLYTPPFELQTLPNQVTLSYGSSSGFQTYDNTQPAYTSTKRRRLDGYIPMSQGSGPSCEHGYDEKPADLDSFSQHADDAAATFACWPDSAMPPSQSLGLPLAKQMTNLSLLLCPCPGFSWGQPDGYCPLPEAPSAVYDLSQPYAAEKQPSVHVSPLSRPHELTLLETGQYDSVHTDLGAYALSSLHNQPGPEHPHLASPPGGAKGTTFPQSQSEPALYASEYDAQGLPLRNTMTFPPDYLTSNDQPHVNHVSHFTGTLDPNSGPFRSVTQFSMLVAGNVMEQQPWAEASLQHQPSNFDILFPDQRGGKRGPFKDPKLREETAQTRRTGSCIRCRMQRIRCESDPEDPGGICLTCTNVANTKAGRFPCLRYKITDIKLYKPGQVPGYEWTRRWTNSITDPIQKWASSEVKVIRVSAGYSPRCIELQVRRFIPQDGDKLVRTWDYRGMRKSVAIPPYALIDLDAAKSMYTMHIQDIMTDTIQKSLDRPQGLLCKTYLRAVRLMRHPSTSMDSVKLLRLTLTLWVSIRLSTTSSFIVGEETLGMPGDILDETSPNAGKIPMPPVLGAQLDLVLIHHIQTKLRREMLEILQKMVLKNKQGTWFVTYLVTFILLHNTALITAHDAGYARKHGMKRRYAREDKVREYHLGANILLAHFHYCNKGMYPFSDECKDKDLRTLAELNDDEIQYVHATRNFAKRHRREWEQVRERGAYEQDFFFVSQLFDENWKPQSTI